MSIQSSTLRPGLLVSLSTSMRGNVRYSKQVLEGEHISDGGVQKARWETERTITDPVEYEAGKKVRAKCSSLIRAVCAQSAFGLLCPESDSDKLDQAIKAARTLADEFNEGAALTRVSVYVLTGRVAPDDVEAIRAINSEIKSLMEDMERGVRNLDVKTIRDAAARAKDVGAMLSADAQARVQIAVDTARTVAKRIVAAGEQAASEVDQSAIRKLTELRTAFLDLDEQQAIAAPSATQRAIDLTPSNSIERMQTTAPTLDV